MLVIMRWLTLVLTGNMERKFQMRNQDQLHTRTLVMSIVTLKKLISELASILITLRTSVMTIVVVVNMNVTRNQNLETAIILLPALTIPQVPALPLPHLAQAQATPPPHPPLLHHHQVLPALALVTGIDTLKKMDVK